MDEPKHSIRNFISWETAWTACFLFIPVVLFLVLFHDRFDFEGFWEFYPFRIFARQSLAERVFPIWMPGIHCGFPVLAASESGIANPFNLLVGGKTGYLFFPIATLLGSGFFTYLYFRKLSLSPVSASIFTIPCVIGPVNLYWYSNVNNLFVLGLFPLGLFLIEGIIEKRTLVASSFLAVATCLMVIGGHPQLAFFSLIVLGLYGTIRIAFTRSGTKEKLHTLGLLLLGFLLGAGLSGYQVFPLLEMVPETLRTGYDQASRESGSLSFPMLTHIIFSRSFDYDLIGEVNVLPYVGILPLVFCLLGIRRKTPPWIKSLWIIIALCFLLSLGYNTPLYNILSMLPGFSMLRKSYWFVGYGCFFLCAIGGYGFDAFRQSSRTKTSSWTTLPLLAFLVLSGFCISLHDTVDIFQQLNSSSLAIVGFFALIVLFTIHLLNKSPGKIVNCLVAMVVVFDLLLFGLWRQPPRNHSVFETAAIAPSSVASYLSHQKLLGQRLAVLPGDMRQNGFMDSDKKPSSELDLAFGTHSFWGWDEPSLRLSRMESALWKLFEKDADLDYLSMAGVGLIQSEIPLEDQSLEYLIALDGYYLYRNKEKLPRAYLAPGLLNVKGPEHSLSILADKSFDPSKTTLVEGKSTAQSREHPLDANVEVDKAGRIEIRAITQTPSLLVLTENFYPGWNAEVNGNAATILIANHQFMAVDVPAGKSHVHFSFDSRSIKAGAALTGGTVLLWMALVLISTKRRWMLAFHTAWKSVTIHSL